MKKILAADVLQRAQQLHNAGALDQAEEMYRALLGKSLDLDGYPYVCYLLGTLCMERRDSYGLAVVLLKEAAAIFEALGPDKVEHKANLIGVCWNNLGTSYSREFSRDKADAAYAKAQPYMPKDPMIPANRAALFVNQGEPQKVMDRAGQSIAIDPNYALGRWHMALGMLETGKLTRRAWDYYEARFECIFKDHRIYGGPKPWWDGSKGKRVVVHGEQGLGDEIMFASCVPDLIERLGPANVILEPGTRLEALFKRSFPDVPVVGTHKLDGSEIVNRGVVKSLDEIDCKIAFGSLAKFFRDGPKSFPGKPYLRADPWQVQVARLRLPESGRPRIGIAWQGGHKDTRIDLRSIDLEELLPILQLPADFVSLQYVETGAIECELFERKNGIKIHHWPEIVKADDYDKTASLVASLDLVVSVCQSVIHLAGALGKECWVMVPSGPAWRYGTEGNRMPWYGDTVKLFRQKKGETWRPMIETIRSELSEWIEKRCASSREKAA